MKKFFIALSVLAALALCVVPSQANMGLPDDVPGCDAVLPFLVGMSAPAINTLVVFTDVRGYGAPPSAPAPNGWCFHYTVNTINSVTVYNDNLCGTNYDVVATDAYSILQLMAPAIRVQLEIDLDGDGINDHWAGYIYFDQTRPIRNQMIGQTLLLNLQQGQAAAANTWFKEISYYAGPPMTAGFIEEWSADSLARAEQRENLFAPAPATAFGLYPRYFINDANTGQTCLIIWKSENWLAVPPDRAVIPFLHILFYNAEEKPVSSNLPLPHELNIVCLDPDYLPNTLHSGVYPKEGWIAIEVPDISGAGFWGDTEWAGYTWTFATGAASESWSYLTQMHRDVRWNGFLDDGWDNIGTLTP